MKKILLFIAILSAFISKAQFQVNQSIGSDSTLVTSKGALKSRLINTPFADTTAANTQRIKFYNGAQIFTYTGGAKLWLRDSTLNKWVQMGASAIVAWGSITGTLSAQTDLQNALNLKLNISDTSAMLFPAYVRQSRTISTDNTLTGGGDLSANRTLKVDTSIIATPNDIANARNKIGKDFTYVSDSLRILTHVNVDDYGAVHNGTTLDDAAFAAAVATGKNVFVGSDATYRVSVPIALKVGQTLFGNGWNTIIKITTNNRAVTLDSNSNVRGLHFYGNGKDGSGTGNTGVFAFQAVGWSITDCMFEEFSGDPTQNGGGGVYVANLVNGNSPGGRISNCYFYNNDGGLVFASRGEYVTATGNTMTKNYVGVLMAAGNLNISDNVIEENAIGIKVIDGTNDSHSNVSNNLVNHNDIPYWVESAGNNMNYTGNKVFFGYIRIIDSYGITFIGEQWGQLDSIVLDNSYVLTKIGCWTGLDLSVITPIYRYNGAEEFDLMGEIQTALDSSSYWIYQQNRTVPGKISLSGAMYHTGITPASVSTSDSVYVKRTTDKRTVLRAQSDIAGGGNTDLGYTASPTNGIVTSNTGTDATIPLVNTTNAGLMSPDMFDSLSKSGYINIVANPAGFYQIGKEMSDTVMNLKALRFTVNGGSSIVPTVTDSTAYWDIIASGSGTSDHTALTNLTTGDAGHTQFALLAGRSGGQTLNGGTASGENLTLNSTSHATKGKIFFGASSAYDGVNARLGIGTTAPLLGQIEAQVNSSSAWRNIVVQNTSAGATAQSSVHFYNNTSGTAITDGATMFYKSSAVTGFESAFGVWQFENAPIVFGTNATERMRIDAGGGVSFSTSFGTSGQILTSAGAGAPPTWTTPGSGSGTVTNVGTGLGLSGGPITTTGTIIADTSYLVNKSTAQVIAGAKNFTSASNKFSGAATDNTATEFLVRSSDKTVSIQAIPVVSAYVAVDSLMAGAYTPTLVNNPAGYNSNVASSAHVKAYYQKMGNIVTVWGTITAVATAGSTNSAVAISLPFASNLAANDVTGGAKWNVTIGVNYTDLDGAVNTDATNDRAVIGWNSHAATSDHNIFFSFTYQVK